MRRWPSLWTGGGSPEAGSNEGSAPRRARALGLGLEPFELTEEAVFDIHATWAFLQAKAGVEMADAMVTEYFKTFRTLCDAPHIGSPS